MKGSELLSTFSAVVLATATGCPVLPGPPVSLGENVICISESWRAEESLAEERARRICRHIASNVDDAPEGIDREFYQVAKREVQSSARNYSYFVFHGNTFLSQLLQDAPRDFVAMYHAWESELAVEELNFRAEDVTAIRALLFHKIVENYRLELGRVHWVEHLKRGILLEYERDLTELCERALGRLVIWARDGRRELVRKLLKGPNSVSVVLFTPTPQHGKVETAMIDRLTEYLGTSPRSGRRYLKNVKDYLAASEKPGGNLS